MAYRLIIITALFTSLIGCQKDESVLNDYDLFGRLQANGGVWKVESYVDFDNSIANPDKVTTTPQNTYMEFYIVTKEVGSVLIDVASVSVFVDSLVTVYDCEAEKERVVFRQNEIFGGTVWTVLENERKRQVWSYTIGDSTREMTFVKCDCDIPKHIPTEFGG